MEKIKIILADDHTLVREGFAALLKKNEPFTILAEAKDGEELMEVLETYTPDVLLLDLSMPKMGGMEVLPLVKAKYPHINSIVLTMHDDAEYAVKCVQKGAKGYLLKNTEPMELYHAIETVAAGGLYYTPAISNILLSNYIDKTSRPPLLSEREKEILTHVVKGLSAKMIAEVLFISQRTVETHKVNIMKKLKVNNTAELITKTYQEKLLDE